MCALQVGKHILAPVRMKPSAKAPHLTSLARYYTTIPDLMGYSQVMCILLYPVAHALGYPRCVAALHLLKEAIDSVDGMVARRTGQCTSFGAILDLATDTAAEYTLMCCIALASLGSTSLFSCFTGLPFSVFLLFFMWSQTVDVAISFYFMGKGQAWKGFKYNCPITRWYYSAEWTHTFLFLSYHIFCAGFYLQAMGDLLGFYIICAFGIPFALRLRCLYVVQKFQLVAVFKMDAGDDPMAS